MKVTEEVIYPNLPMLDYIGDPCPAPSVSTGVIETITDQTAMHAYAEHPRLGAMREDSGARSSDWGTGVHEHALVPGGESRIEWLDFESFGAKGAKAEKDAARAAGKIPMLLKEKKDVLAAAKAARKTLERLGAGKAEHTLIWKEPVAVKTAEGKTEIVEVWNRARPDYLLVKDAVVDLKTVTSANPEEWKRNVLRKQGYDSQGTHVLAGIRKLLGEERRVFFLLQELHYPYLNKLVLLGPNYVAHATTKRGRALKIWGQALRTKIFPGWGDDVYTAEPEQYEVDAVARKAAA